MKRLFMMSGIVLCSFFVSFSAQASIIYEQSPGSSVGYVLSPYPGDGTTEYTTVADDFILTA